MNDLELTIRMGKSVVPLESVPPDLASFLALRRVQLRTMFGTASVRERIDEKKYKKALDFAKENGLLSLKHKRGVK